MAKKTSISTGSHTTLAELVQLEQAARQLQLRALRRVKTEQHGASAASLRGRGMDFASVRAYQAGDDIRHMDWRVMARTHKPHTKVFTTERERPVWFVVDQSTPMQFATQVAFKAVIAARIAAILAWTAHQQHDRLGALVYDEQTLDESPLGSSHAQVLAFLHQLSKVRQPYDLSTEIDLSVVLKRLQFVLRPGSLIFILSDFYQIDEASDKLLSLLSRHNDIVMIRIQDIIEITSPPANRYGITNGQQQAIFDTRQRGIADRYYQQCQHARQQVEQRAQQLGVTLIDILTHEAWQKKLSQYFGRAAYAS